MPESELKVEKKAFQINMEPRIYGAFAEIGAGQDVARRFFAVGGAAGTVAKTISAYDMTFSDAIYGACGRYVSRARLHSMLTHEYNLLIERLDEKVGRLADLFCLMQIPSPRGVFAGMRNHKGGWASVFRSSLGRSQTKSLSMFECSMPAISSSRKLLGSSE